MIIQDENNVLVKQLEESQARKLEVERQQKVADQRLADQKLAEQKLAEQKKAAETKVVAPPVPVLSRTRTLNNSAPGATPRASAAEPPMIDAPAVP